MGKEATVFYILKGKALSGKKHGESPEAKFSGDLKTHLDVLPFFIFSLWSSLQCGEVWFQVFVFFQLKAKLQHKWRPGKVWQVHRSIQVTIERMSSHKYPRCQNSNETISSLISCLLITHKLSIHLWNPWNMASEDVTFYKWKGRVFVPVLFVGYLGIVFAKSLIRLSSGIVKIQIQAGRKKNYKK